MTRSSWDSGIHGEKGVERTAMLAADALCNLLVSSIVDELALASGERVALLVNGLGGTPHMELDVVLRAAHESLATRGIRIERAWAGTFLSALDMPGCSVSLLRVDDATLNLLDASTEARAWPGAGMVNRDIRIDTPTQPSPSAAAVRGEPSQWTRAMKAALESVANALIENEPRLTELDSVAGDGDLGASMKRAAHALLEVRESDLDTPAGALAALSVALRRAIAGSSGPFYATALMRASRHLQRSTTQRRWIGRTHSERPSRLSAIWVALKQAIERCWTRFSPAVSAYEGGADFRQSRV